MARLSLLTPWSRDGWAAIVSGRSRPCRDDPHSRVWTMITPLLLALRQLGDRAFRGPLLKGLGGAVLVFAGLVVARGLGRRGAGRRLGLAGEGGGGARRLAGPRARGVAVRAGDAGRGRAVPRSGGGGGGAALLSRPAAGARGEPGGAGAVQPAVRVADGGAEPRDLAPGARRPARSARCCCGWCRPSALGHGLFEGVAQRRMGVAEARALAAGAGSARCWASARCWRRSPWCRCSTSSCRCWGRRR